MNILTQSLPTKIKVNGIVYDINYDYRTAINILLAFEDNDLMYQEKVYIMLKNLYKDDILESDIDEAIMKAIKFLDLGKEYEEKPIEPRTYSFSKDGNYIFTGINSSHHIDVEKEHDLHWWKFMAMFMDMSSECTFGELVYYRKRKQEGKLSKEEKENYKKIKDIVELDYDNKPSETRKNFFERYRKNKK